uniref:Uncharacterized protein n=1 Tax=Solanum tuberosum TaxID=4113 RepID=M1DLL9_SOLTU
MEFSDRDAPYPCLEIVENKQHSRAKVLTLKVHPPVIGAFPLLRKTLDTSHHLPEWSSTETKDVTDDFSATLEAFEEKPKELNTQQCEFAELDSISIDTAIFEDGAAGSIMPLTELAHQLGLEDIPSDVDVFEDCITSSNSLNVVKSSHLPLVEVKSQAANEIQLTKPKVPFAEKVEISQNISTTNVEVVETSQIGCSYVSRDLVHPLLRIASNFEPQKTISSFKLSYISGMWRTLCECITQFSVESLENLKELEAGVALILKGLREVNIINLSPLEVLLEDFFKKHRDYDVARLSTSQKITRDSHQELLSAAQQCLDTANEERINMDKQLEELQKVLTRAEKEPKVWTSKKKKTISLIEDHQKRLSKNQETITNREDEIHAIEKSIPLSETEIKEIAMLFSNSFFYFSISNACRVICNLLYMPDNFPQDFSFELLCLKFSNS